MRFDDKFSKSTIIAQGDVMTQKEEMMNEWFSRFKLGKQTVNNEQKYSYGM